MNFRLLARVAGLLLGSFGLAATGSAYYYYVHFPSRSGPYHPIVEKFDLNALPGKTVTFFVSNLGPGQLATGDSYQAIVGEIRAAAQTWSDVATSDLRTAYGGLFTPGTIETAPGIDVEFSDDIPPGLLALGGPQTRADQAFGPNGPFIPIVRSKLFLPSDMSQVPSWSEKFGVTLVHEFGHTLGLQHTLASAVMSTLVTSGSSKAAPLAADDIAGISLLYPADKYLAGVGSISGRVSMSGNGVSLASVVALSASNPAITTLTNPDGTYQIDGVPPGQYYVYVHPLPPALQGESSFANIVYPCPIGKDCKQEPKNALGPNYTAFGAQFYPATRDWTQASVIAVNPQGVTSGINFSVSSRNFQAIHSVRTYGFSSTVVAVASPPLTEGLSAPVIASGAGLLQANNVITPGLNVSVLGTSAQAYGLRPYPPPVPYIAVDVLVNFTSGPGPKHLLFSLPNDMYLLPAGFTVVTNPPPSITAMAAGVDGNGNRVVTLTGTNLGSDTRILFDGAPGTVQNFTSDGKLVVALPQAPGGYVATVVALNSDGQSSLFLQGQNPTTYTYDPADAPTLTVTPTFIAPGVETLVDVVGANTNFIDGQTAVGFGTSDALVKKVTVLSPTHFTAVVSSSTFVATGSITVTNGLRIISQALGSQIIATNPDQPGR
jgi:hypothetical protein